jgi:archaellin
MIDMRIRKYAISLYLLALVVILPLAGYSQVADSLSTMRAFIKLCNVYQTLPVQVELRLLHSSNMIRSKEDTATVFIRFHLQAHGSYTQYGELEQVANDSLLLLVNHTAHRMILYPNHASIANRMQVSSALLTGDSSVEKMVKKYTAMQVEPAAGMGGIQVSSRSVLYGTDLPSETIEASYHKVSQQLARIIQVQRSLVPVDSVQYQNLSADPAFTGKRFRLPQGFFVIREQTATYEYVQVVHNADQPLPVQVSDRITRKEQSGYEPVKAYEAFVLNQYL